MIQEYSFLGFPLSGNEVRKIAFSFAEANGFEGSVKCTMRLEGNGSVSF